MPNFLTTWFRYHEHARRGRLLAQAVERAAGDLQMVDAALLDFVRSEIPMQLAIRRQIGANVYGFFLPCLVEKKKV